MNRLHQTESTVIQLCRFTISEVFFFFRLFRDQTGVVVTCGGRKSTRTLYIDIVLLLFCIFWSFGTTCIWFRHRLKGLFPHSWEDINSEINFKQMQHSARIYQFPLTNGLCCIQTTHTVQNLHWDCYYYRICLH